MTEPISTNPFEPDRLTSPPLPNAAGFGPPANAQYVRRRPARTALLTVGVAIVAGGLVWLTMGRPSHDSVAAAANDAPAPMGAPLRVASSPAPAARPAPQPPNVAATKAPVTEIKTTT